MKKSWREKLADSKGLPKVGAVAGVMKQRRGAGKVVVPAPLEVDALMKQVPKGRRFLVPEYQRVRVTSLR